MLMLMVFVSTAMAQSSLLVSEGLLATQENGQYKWTSEKMTMPEGASKLRVTFLQTSNNEKPAGFPCVAIAEFYLYDKDGAAVALAEANFSSNATQGNEGKMSSICDGFTTQQNGQGAYDWYWHSKWSGDPAPYGHHYLEIDLTNVTADLSEYKIGWVTRRSQASPAEVVISTGATTEEAAQNFDTAYLTSLLTSNEEAPVYFTIRNIRNGDYCASYTRNNMNLALGSTKTKASIFYFTGAVEGGLATVKIHNYAADGVCMADFGSWTEEGINWYVQLSGDTNKRGFAISKMNDLTNNAYSWNNDANRNNKVAAYNGNDVGSTFVFVKLSATEVQNIVNEFISGPEKLTSGTSYRFRSLSGFNYMTGGDENVGTNNTAGDNTAFAYYVSPNTGAKYLYNISSEKFIGTTSTGNAKIPLSATVTSSELTFKSSTNAIYPIMISTNNGGGAINHSSWYGGIINWQGGFGDTGSADNSFSAEKVKVIDEETLATIEQLVGDYEMTLWKEQNLANLGRVGGYALDLKDEIEAVTNYEQQLAFETANEKIAINTNSYYRLVCVNPKDQVKDGEVISDDSYNTLTFNGKSNLVTAPSSASNINQIFKFEDAGDNYFYLKNLNADGYLNKIQAGTYRSAIVTKEEACRVNIVSYANGYSNLTQYRLQNEGSALYSLFAENHPTEAIPYACAGWESGANSASAWYIVPATDIEVSINEFASICLPFAVEVEDATAYAVEETTNGYAVLGEKADIPANEGAILAGNGVATLTIVDEATADWSANMLEGTTVDTYIEVPAYVLSKVNGVVGLYTAKMTNGAWKNNANKAYLPKSTGMDAASYSFRFDRGTTAVEDVVVENEVKAIYDLTGRRVEAITAAGIYIVNGKKVLVK